MNRKPSKIQIKAPFEQVSSNWELVHNIQTTLNTFLNHSNTFSSSSIDDSERLDKGDIDKLMNCTRKVLQFIQFLRSQQKNIQSIKSSAAASEEKLKQSQQTLRNYDKKFTQRTKAMVDQNRVLKQTNDKMKRTFAESEQSLKATIEQSKGQIKLLREELGKLEEQKKNLLQLINQNQKQLNRKQDLIEQLQKVTKQTFRVQSSQQKLEEILKFRIQKKKKPLFIAKQKQFPDSPPLEQLGMKNISALSQILYFLTPFEILELAATNKKMRILCSTRICVEAVCRGIIALKNKNIKYYRNHIIYFQKLREKVPTEVIKTAYFRYHILKESAGFEIKKALNASLDIFKGQFQGEQLHDGLPNFNQEIPLKFNFSQATLLEVDNTIVDKFKEVRTHERNQLVKEFEEMNKKIKESYEFYRADEQTKENFTLSILKHFSKVFILAKMLYFQVQQLQNLNSFLISELNTWDRQQIDKNLQLQDLKAELEAEKKLKLFFTDKSIKSQQKALLEENLKLTYQMKYNRLNDLMNITCAQKDEVTKKYQILSKKHTQLQSQSKDLKKNHEGVKEKYHHVIQELAVVKQTIIRMNII